MRIGSVRTRLLLLLGGVLAVVALTATYRAYERRAADTQYMLESLRARTRLLAEQQSEAVRRTIGFLDFAHEALDLAVLAHDPDCSSKLLAYMHSDDYVGNIFLTDTQGNVICNPRGVKAPTSVSDRAYLREALDSPSAVVGDPVMGRITQRWVVPFAQRYEDRQGKVIGAIVVSLDIAWINKAFNRLTSGDGIQLGLVTSRGLVLARQPDPAAWVGKDISSYPVFRKLMAAQGEGAIEATSHAGERRIYAFTRFAQASHDTIYLWMSVSSTQATAKADRQFRSALLLIGGLLVTTFGLAWLGGYRLLVRPIEQIVQAARRLANGDFSARTGLPHTTGEIGQLAMAFDEMAGQLAGIDPVTGLRNLQAFESALSATLDAARSQDRTLAVLRLQIKDFAQLEGSHGPSVVNELIRAMGQQIQAALVSSALVARLGDSNFAVACPMGRDMLVATQLVEQLQAALEANPIMVAERSLSLEICFGLSFFPDDGATADELLQRAGMALGQSLLASGSRLYFYEAAMNERLKKRSQRLADLRLAIQEQAFELHYQPQIALASGRLIGFEALLRWRHPVEGWIPPLEFIGLAEESGLMVPLGNWILRRAASQLLEWRAADPSCAALVMAVNVSAVQLAEYGFQSELQAVLESSGLPPHCLELEITESQLMRVEDKPHELLRQFKALGLLLAIDDFGTGYSSLAYLKHFDVDKLKIDKSFVDHISTGGGDRAIVEATIAMAHKLGLQVIAEGVESAEQTEALRQLGCDQIQGYYISRPLPAAAALDFIRTLKSGIPAAPSA